MNTAQKKDPKVLRIATACLAFGILIIFALGNIINNSHLVANLLVIDWVTCVFCNYSLANRLNRTALSWVLFAAMTLGLSSFILVFLKEGEPSTRTH